jgi:transcriptional regulator with XRE-family HTH domain
MSQEKLGKELGLTFQQVQKNERGTNRIGASRLYQLSDILDVPVSYFFDGLDQPAQTAQDDPLARRETLELVRAYYRIKSGKVRKRIFELTKTIAKAGDTE